MTLRIGELFAGYGGLGAGVRAVLGGEIAWFSEFDAAPSKILAHHWPDVPNHGDITKIDWATVEPVDILTGGFPCQDVSLAGARRGLKEGTRSGLWSYFAAAIDALRPQLVVVENVRGLLSATAGDTEEYTDEEISDLESGSGAVGGLGRNDRPVLRALGAVLGNLAELGYDAEWCGLRAADAGAPHGRYRVFILAHPEGQPWRIGDGDDLQARRRTVGRAQDAGASADASSTQDADLAIGDQWRQSAPGQAEGGRAWADAGGRGGALAADPTSCGCDRGACEPFGCEVERVAAAGSGEDVAADTNSAGRVEHGGGVTVPQEHAPTQHGSPVDWGIYGPAIERWESVIGRPAPAPTNPDGKGGNHRLSSGFVEWMMGIPAGHVTSPAIGLTRNEQLRALGNGVVPQQAALALTVLLNRLTA